MMKFLPVFVLFSVKLWLLRASASGNDTDRLALLKFKEGIFKDPHGILNSWNDSNPFCNWVGIKCSSRHQRVTSMVLSAQNLVGSISPYIGNLSFLRVIDLQNNTIHGSIPQEVGRLFRLQLFNLRNNTVVGEIPATIYNCSRLKVLQLGYNKIAGPIPGDIGFLGKLEVLNLGVNNLTGKVPTSIGNISALSAFSVAVNNLEGSITEEMGKLKSLNFFSVALNKLSGVIPPLFFNITTLKTIYTAENQLHGILPDNLCLTLPNLQIFGIAINRFFGAIPKSISNCSHMEKLDLSRNNFMGQVPADLGKLRSLSRLTLGNNNLGSNSTHDLTFFTSLVNCSSLQTLDIGQNNFGGILPSIIANLSTQLSQFYLGDNQFSGPIPVAFYNLRNLIILAMQNNLLRGSIPSYFAMFSNLQGLALHGNRLSGQIPSTLGNLTQLLGLSLFRNQFEGRIPSSIANCRRLYELDVSDNHLIGKIPSEILRMPSLSKILNLSYNSLTGNLPADVGKLQYINALDLSENGLSGEIPRAIDGCTNLEFLYMQGNSFGGSIPSLTSLKGLKYLDLSRNNLTGQISIDLSEMPFRYLNLSFNNLEGEVPTEGVFKNASWFSLTGNKRLCGGIPELHLPECPAKPRQKGKSLALKLAIIITCTVLFVILMLAFIFLCRMRKSKKKLPAEALMFDHVVMVTYGDLYHATGGFSGNCLIGSGSFGTVYKGLMDQFEMPIAVKVLKLEQNGASKSFLAECKALRNVRHRNLVKLLTYCSSIDNKQNDFKALIFEFMPNGSVDRWLHADVGSGSSPSNLNLLQRLNIAIDVASAVEHLHNFGECSIVHCDLKPSNVLLDDDMVAHLSDFGLARLFSTTIGSSESKSSTIGMKGTVGYAAPEYGIGGAVSKEGDVYSFGILVLEMFTGKRPTDEIFKDGSNLHHFVKAALPEKLLDVADPQLIPSDITIEVDDSNGIVEEEEINSDCHIQTSPNMQQCLLSVLEIGLGCSVESPKDRMNMMDVTRELHLIRTHFLGSYQRGHRPRRRVRPIR